eukprot:12725514-Alexandrium_andersonii.AAC.1
MESGAARRQRASSQRLPPGRSVAQCHGVCHCLRPYSYSRRSTRAISRTLPSPPARNWWWSKGA